MVLGRHEEARAAFANGLRLDPTDRRLLQNMGIEYMRIEQYNEAAKCFEAAIKHGEAANSYDGLGRALGKSGRLNDAVRVLEDGIRRFPDDPYLHLSLAETYLDMGRKADADKELARGAELKKTQNP